MVEELFKKVAIAQFVFIICILTALIVILNKNNKVNVLEHRARTGRARVTIDEHVFGTINEAEIVKKYTLRNANHFELDLISYGATIKSIYVKDKNRYLTNVALGFNTLEGSIQFSIQNKRLIKDVTI
jgi:hypothetical protein